MNAAADIEPDTDRIDSGAPPPHPQQVFSREDVERQIAIAAIVAMKESAFLVAIDGIVGGRQACVTIEDDGDK